MRNWIRRLHRGLQDCTNETQPCQSKPHQQNVDHPQPSSHPDSFVSTCAQQLSDGGKRQAEDQNKTLRYCEITSADDLRSDAGYFSADGLADGGHGRGPVPRSKNPKLVSGRAVVDRRRVAESSSASLFNHIRTLRLC